MQVLVDNNPAEQVAYLERAVCDAAVRLPVFVLVDDVVLYWQERQVVEAAQLRRQRPLQLLLREASA